MVAVVGSPAAVAAMAQAADCPEPTALPFCLEIAPLGDRQLERLTKLRPGAYRDGFRSLSAALEQPLATAYGHGLLAYIETEYFGGAGSQAAAAFADGDMIFSAAKPDTRDPIGPDDPINPALRRLGVEATGHVDAFAALGLGRFRSLEHLGLDEDEDD
ncbi:hypothetical protein [Rhizobium mulingense]|uniref:hypothetical protein n=1 Tax=Rhizobium mulingense TaxID=3031128 RepID=UPI002B4A2BE0|nr:hypothetical protein [Rhizobium sp. MJ21]MEB3042561.1 hypothetical protein [Rhizobium sp. MJ21]